MTDTTPSSTSPLRLTALIVAHNEAAMLPDALASVQALCDQIVVVLDRCTDDSKKIAAKYTKHIIEGAWEVEGPRRMTGIDACPEGWILELDADERVTPAMAQELHRRLPQAVPGYFLVPIYNYVGKRLVMHGWAGAFGTNAAKKLFYKGHKVWGNQRVHPTLVMTGPEYQLEHGLTHLIDTDINDMIDRLQRYTDAQAADLRSSGKPLPPFRRSLRRGLTRFYKSYCGRRGYKEGKMGFLLALMAMLMPILTHLKAEFEDGK